MNERVTIVCATNRLWVVGAETSAKTICAYPASFTAAGGPLVFGASYSSCSDGRPGALNNYGSFRFYGAKIYERADGVDTLVHRYVPCWDRITGVTGLYDTVAGAFLAVASGKMLAVGPHVDPAGTQLTVR